MLVEIHAHAGTRPGAQYCPGSYPDFSLSNSLALVSSVPSGTWWFLT